MINFKQFFKTYVKPGFEQDTNHLGEKTITHNSESNGRKIQVDFTQNKPDILHRDLKKRLYGKGHYQVDFSVNGDLKRDFRGGAQGKEGIADGIHVKNALHKFIKTYKPKSLYYSANEPFKARSYRNTAKTLIKQYGGEHHELSPISHLMVFKK